MRSLTFCAGLALASPAMAQDEPPPYSYPAIPRNVASPDKLVPPGLIAVSEVRGDLNRDGFPDVALLLWTQEADRAATRQDRDYAYPSYRLLIAFARPKGGYQIIEDNSTFLDGPDPSGVNDDPLDAGTLEIVRGALKISRTYLRGQYHYRFRWSGGAFRLIGYESSGSDGRCTSDTSINFLTRRARMATQELSQDATEHKAVRRTKARLATLAEASRDEFYPEELINGTRPEC